MEKVNKHNSTITEGDVRNKTNFAKSRKDVEKSAKELVKLAKMAKPIKEPSKRPRIADPQKKWDEYMDDFIKTSEKLGEVAAQGEATVRGRQECVRRREEVMRRLPQRFPRGRRNF